MISIEISIEISTEALRHFLNECMDDGLAPLFTFSMKEWTMGWLLSSLAQ